MARPPWTPEGFDDWQSFFPATGFVRPPAPLDLTDRFISCWHQPEARLPKSTLIVLIAGLYSEFMPRCFYGVPRALKSSGHKVLRVPVRSSRGVMAQGSHISKVLATHLRQGQRFVVLAHSKGASMRSPRWHSLMNSRKPVTASHWSSRLLALQRWWMNCWTVHPASAERASCPILPV